MITKMESKFRNQVVVFLCAVDVWSSSVTAAMSELLKNQIDRSVQFWAQMMHAIDLNQIFPIWRLIMDILTNSIVAPGLNLIFKDCGKLSIRY